MIITVVRTQKWWLELLIRVSKSSNTDKKADAQRGIEAFSKSATVVRFYLGFEGQWEGPWF